MERVMEAHVRRQRVIQTTLLFVILATLPCYCVGFVLLGVAPGSARSANVTPSAGTTSTGSTSQPTDTFIPTITPYPTFPVNTLSPLLPTPTQMFFPIYTLTWTPLPPTRLPPTITPIVIVPPTSTPIIVPTATNVPPTRTPPPTATNVPPTATHTPTATVTP